MGRLDSPALGVWVAHQAGNGGIVDGWVLVHSRFPDSLGSDTIAGMDVFKVTAAGGDGLSYWEARSLRKPTRGTRCRREEVTWLDDLRALSLVIAEGAAFSHTTAAHLLGLPIPEDQLRPFHLTVALDKSRGERTCVIWHKGDIAGKRTRIKGFIITVPCKTWVDLGTVLDLPDLVAVTDVLLRRRHVTAEELVVPKGIRGARMLRQAAALADPRSRSPRESQLRVHLHNAGLPAPDVNADIYIDGVWTACGDLVWWEYKVVVEYDGEHHGTLDQRHQDAITRAALRAAGWLVIELDAKHFNRLSLTIEEIKEALKGRGWAP